MTGATGPNAERFIQPVTDAELVRRWQALRLLMDAQQLDALVVQNSNDWLGGYVRWLTGVPANNAYPRAVVFPRDGCMTVVEQGPSGGSRQPAADDAINRGVAAVLTTPSYSTVRYTRDYDARLVAGRLRELCAGSIGMINPEGAYYGFGAALREQLSGLRLVDVTEQVDMLKAIKSDEEWSLIQRAAALQDATMAAVVDYVRPGMRDFEVTCYAQFQAGLLGAEQGIYLGSSSPAGTAAVFRPPHERGRRLQAGDAFALLLETNGPGGYYTELGRTIVLGTANAALKAAAADAVAAQRRTLERLRPGAACADIFAAHNADMAARSLPTEHRLYAHGQGYDMVERPLIRDDETMKIAPGMSIVVHPGYVTREVNALVCDNYRIGRDGPGPSLHMTKQDVIETG